MMNVKTNKNMTIECECGVTLNAKSYSGHLATAKHRNRLLLQPVMAELIQKPAARKRRMQCLDYEALFISENEDEQGQKTGLVGLQLKAHIMLMWRALSDDDKNTAKKQLKKNVVYQYNKKYYEKNKRFRLQYMKQYRNMDVLCPDWMFKEKEPVKKPDIICPDWMFALSSSWKRSYYDRQVYDKKRIQKMKYPDIMCPDWVFELPVAWKKDLARSHKRLQDRARYRLKRGTAV